MILRKDRHMQVLQTIRLSIQLKFIYNILNRNDDEEVGLHLIIAK